jgi:hypothetical protein
MALFVWRIFDDRMEERNPIPSSSKQMNWITEAWHTDVWTRLVFGVGVFVWLWPATEPWGWIDHWPAWQLYAPRNSRAIVFIHWDDVEKLPSQLRRFVEGPDRGNVWRRLRLDRWSLAEFRVPLYPQARFQLAMAKRIQRQYELRHVKFIVQSPSDRRTGRRESEVIFP